MYCTVQQYRPAPSNFFSLSLTSSKVLENVSHEESYGEELDIPAIRGLHCLGVVCMSSLYSRPSRSQGRSSCKCYTVVSNSRAVYDGRTFTAYIYSTSCQTFTQDWFQCSVKLVQVNFCLAGGFGCQLKESLELTVCQNLLAILRRGGCCSILVAQTQYESARQGSAVSGVIFFSITVEECWRSTISSEIIRNNLLLSEGERQQSSILSSIGNLKGGKMTKNKSKNSVIPYELTPLARVTATEPNY